MSSLQNNNIENLPQAIASLKSALKFLENLELSNISNFKENEIKHGGIVVFDHDGHGLVAASKDLGKYTLSEATKLCRELEINGYKDWRLPTKDELHLLFENLHSNGIGNFRKLSYWSNTQASSYTNYFQNFDSGDISDYSMIDGLFWVRPVRLF
jgi:hypothetical protein